MSYDTNINFYHGVLSRDDADLLLKESKEEGTFLVRNSNTSPGDYVLSVLFENEVIHYQIRKHENDAFFSIEEQTICHGLETLIEYYQEVNHGLVTVLRNPIMKDPLPPDTKRHGRTNLLHRATREGEMKIVEGLLKCGYRSLEAKNQEGQTAVHLACNLSGQSEHGILEKLISAGANVNCRDTEGNTPLHYACCRNSPKIIQILVQEGGAHLQMRNTKTGWVALHEASSRGYVDCVKMLLSLKAPLRPRTNLNELPVDLARKNGHQECADFLSRYTCPPPETKRSEWYHGTLGRNQAIEILKGLTENTDGSFLVRYSGHSGYVLTMLYLEQDYHYQILTRDTFHFIDDGPYLDSLEMLVEYYMSMVDGLPCKLQTPASPQPSPPLPTSTHPILSCTLPRPSRTNSRKSSVEVGDFSSLRIHHSTTLPLMKHKPPLIVPEILVDDEQAEKPDGYIPRDNIILQDPIGEGEFGSVFRGILQDSLGFEQKVAIKTLRTDLAETNREDFLREANVMMKLNHECIVKFIGICAEPMLMVQELVPLGSVLGYIRRNSDKVSPNYELKIWASQIASGMLYLEEQRFVHRDLAARNILLECKYQVKITDFGLSRALSCNQDYYRASRGGRWPIKWYAPESYNHGQFSSASDVWGFGVTLWEIFSYGDQPWGSRTGSEVIDLVDAGQRLTKPRTCPNEIYDIMEQCWEYNPRNRPTFSELTEKFTCPEYTNIQELRNTISR